MAKKRTAALRPTREFTADELRAMGLPVHKKEAPDEHPRR
jgi:hypothetical protein